jgi:hypothetical protein
MVWTPNNRRIVCDCKPRYGSQITSMAEVQANSRLIATAPDLLAAAQAAMQCLGELPPTQARVEVAQMLTAAIAKATGT